MRDAVRAVIERCERATLVFDAMRIATNMQRVAATARGAQITPLFAMKSFPHARVIALAAEHLGGFDAASPGELAQVPANTKLVSLVDPTGLAQFPAATVRVIEPTALSSVARQGRVIVGCETVDRVRAAPADADIAIRVSASITGRDPAVGAILDGTGHRRSRFGVSTREEIEALEHAAREDAPHRRIGLHVHHGPVTATSAERFIASARAAIELAGFAPDFIDLGGAWHGIGIEGIDRAFAQIREALPSIDILVEPGRLYVEGAGFAVGPTRSIRDVGDRLLVTCDLSRVCHLRWSQVELVARAPHPGEGKKIVVVGPTCYEEDVIGEYTVDPAHVEASIVLSNVSGYAVAWNTSFGGVAAADVVFVDA